MRYISAQQGTIPQVQSQQVRQGKAGHARQGKAGKACVDLGGTFFNGIGGAIEPPVPNLPTFGVFSNIFPGTRNFWLLEGDVGFVIRGPPKDWGEVGVG
jgi:hypothetical protein